MKTTFVLYCMLLLIAASLFTTPAKAQVNVNDSLALVDLYNSTNGSGWNYNTNWLTKKPVSKWYGVTVKGRRVTQIDLGLNNLKGTIPSSIGNLENLTFLNIYFNQLSGTIPSSIFNLVHLTILRLSGNKLSGSIPSSISNLVNLEFLDLQSNHLNGSIPSSIGDLTNLQDLNLGNNQLNGSIPSSIGDLTNLQDLNLANNQLNGSIPSSIENCVNLVILYLGYNQLSGSIPSSIGNFPDLYDLSLDGNQLSGSIPSSIGNLAHLQSLYLSFNKLTGNIPSSIGKLVGLQYFVLNNNQLTGGIPFSFRNLKSLEELDLDHNQLAQPNNADFPMIDKQNSYGNVSYNHNTFNGLEFVATKLPHITYTPQAIIPVHQSGNTLSVDAGGTLSNNTYKWFRVRDTDSTTIIGNSTFSPGQRGKYYVKVTNAIATKLTLYSDTVEFKGSNIIANNHLTAEASRNKMKQDLLVSPNPANSQVIVQINGTASIIMINDAGKVMLSKTITNHSVININAFANGVYYIKNITTGEVKKIVISH